VLPGVPWRQALQG
jgi:hypothetical protein